MIALFWVSHQPEHISANQQHSFEKLNLHYGGHVLGQLEPKVQVVLYHINGDVGDTNANVMLVYFKSFYSHQNTSASKQMYFNQHF